MEVPVPSDPKGREAALRLADERARDLRDRYLRAPGAQGALAGAASLTAMASAVTLLATWRSLSASPCGRALHLDFYRATPSHRPALEAAVEFVAVASETDPTVRKRTIATVGQHLPEHPPFSDLSGELPRVIVQQVGNRGVKEAVEQMVRRALRGRLAGTVPLLGAAAGGVAWGWLAGQVCEASRQLRVAFLTRHTPLQLTDVMALHPQMPAGASPSI
ncbi:MAG: hypothetical protein M3O70_01490 [Actinomycetota bacterium]|nr:hypothetical protein [Actinomycetota bacterium]